MTSSDRAEIARLSAMTLYDKSKLSEYERRCCFFDDDNRTVEEVRSEFQTDLPARCRDCPMLETRPAGGGG